ncbi:activator of HSP90 ATPase [Amycolatopsis sp. WAC 04182]|uniref:SRPBCC family protein n=1 Tax=Amycolatopsis sp. WAC 04182 TaxID=2203198 RepID=UPI000F77CA4C|nr:SRPBCC family protein [Amycolatopsis sp. WAC 04182]RSN65904.1 activator of HSP90 ATPase [Amycolatopsis sp. WAC 04182]
MGRTLSVTKAGDLEIVMTRSFDAPRVLVFDAWTKPELVRRWFGPRDWEVVECEIDLRVGGRWRYRLHHGDGKEMLLQGVYQEIDRPERLVSLETNEGCDASEGQALATLTLVERDGVTTLTQVVRYGSKRIRDAVLESGMERGVGEGFDKLAESMATPVEA